MPLSTPSPHRFLAAHAPPSSQKPKPKPPSGLRHATQPTDYQPEDATPKPTPARRFVIATQSNKQHAARNDLRHGDSWTRPHLPAMPRPRPTLQKVESIEEGSGPDSPPASQDDTVMTIEVERTEREVVDLTDAGDAMDVSDAAHDDEDEDSDADMLFTPHPQNPQKRRRLSHSPQPSPPSSPTQSAAVPRRPRRHAPQIHLKAELLQPTLPPSSHSHRFLLPTSRVPATSTTSQTPAPSTPAPSRPHFLLPPQPTSTSGHDNPAITASAPRPDIFSPSRKGQKYVPGGLAATVQSWIVGEASTGYMAQAQLSEASGCGVVWGRDREDGVEARLKLGGIRGARMEEEDGVECVAGGVTFADAHIIMDEDRDMDVDSTQETRVLLIGPGGMRGRGRGTGQRPLRLRSGDTVGIRAPTWSVQVEGSEWRVGVDWLVL